MGKSLGPPVVVVGMCTRKIPDYGQGKAYERGQHGLGVRSRGVICGDTSTGVRERVGVNTNS
jgi:hypothetical protein